MAANEVNYATFKVILISSKNGSDGFSETWHVGSVFDDILINDVIIEENSPK